MGYFLPLIFIHEKYSQIKNINYIYNIPTKLFYNFKITLI